MSFNHNFTTVYWSKKIIYCNYFPKSNPYKIFKIGLLAFIKKEVKIKHFFLKKKKCNHRFSFLIPILFTPFRICLLNKNFVVYIVVFTKVTFIPLIIIVFASSLYVFLEKFSCCFSQTGCNSGCTNVFIQ